MINVFTLGLALSLVLFAVGAIICPRGKVLVFIGGVFAGISIGGFFTLFSLLAAGHAH